MAKCRYHGANRGAIMIVGTRDPAMDNSQRARLLLQELWRHRLEFARLQLEAAKDHVEAVKEFQSQAPCADGAHAFRLALKSRETGVSGIQAGVADLHRPRG